MPDDSKKQKAELTDKISELESLVDLDSLQNGVKGDGITVIPILDELVTPDDNNETSSGEDEKDEYEHQIEDIADKVEQKLSSELDEIVNLLKGNLKDSIMHELHDQIKKDPVKKSED